MMSFFDRLLGQEQSSANQAKERMKLVLIHDRTDLSPASMDRLKDDLIEVISRHVEIDPNTVAINVAQNGREHRLIADIPLGSVRRRRVG